MPYLYLSLLVKSPNVSNKITREMVLLLDRSVKSI
jgi:hypothetical protein